MPYVITDACIGTKDQSCVAVCPVDCIHETGRMFVIDPDECIDCGACEPECPVEAIFPSDSVPAGQERFVEINAVWVSGGAEAVDSTLGQA
jgi:ferredoxin